MNPSIALIYFLCIIYYNLKFIGANDVHGCGGYIQSGVTISYSNVKIRLLSQQGSLKYETECAPNNGYYFLPIYDKGNYIIKVFPPPGWKFEPDESEVNFDGETDICSQGKDINFNFQGFAVVGKVVSTGSDSGPAGVIVTLKKDGKEIIHTETTEGGRYIFAPLASGHYIVIASHDHWEFSKNEAIVTVKDSNGDAGKSLIINGYKISGKTSLQSKFFNQFFITLHGSPNQSFKLGCISGSPSAYQKKSELPPIICHTPIKNDGRFSFSKVPTGRYVIAPYLASENEYQIVPSHINVEVKHGDVIMTESFSVNGGELFGRVLSGQGNGLKDVKVLLDGGRSVMSDINGEFVFPTVQFGSHILSFVYGVMEFNDERIDFSLSMLEMAPIKPARFRTCFSVNMDSNSELQEKWSIIVSHSGKDFKNIYVQSNSKECVFLPMGAYTASIRLSESSVRNGIRFGPSEHKFSINMSPIENLRFSQFLGEVHGTIDCQEPCPPLTLNLRSVRADLAKTRSVQSINGKFSFNDIIPGEYQIFIDKEEWCWKEDVFEVTVDRKRLEFKFVQTGYRLTLVAAHHISLGYSINSKNSGVIDVPEGTSRICMPSSGHYIFKPTGCHQIRHKVVSWDTSSPKLVTVAASHFKVTGEIESKEENAFSVVVISSSNEKKVIKLPSSFKANNIFPFEYWAAEGETVSFVPSSTADLFKFFPPAYNITMRSNCIMNAVKFVAERSLFLKGFIKPPISDAFVTVEENTVINQYSINTEGLFIVGPLNRDKTYIVRAEKVGYVFKPPSYTFDLANQVDQVDVIRAHFDAQKLAEIVVNVVDESGNPLEGVLISTSGGRDYRQNSLTNENGTFVFHSLMPNEYFLRPMMKEYAFEPSSKVVYVEGGKTVNVVIRGIRVAYSVYGKTSSISGEQECDILVEAVSVGDKCSHIQEEATSDSGGMFRIRGLKPKCDYEITLKKGSGFRSIPKKSFIKMEDYDMKDVNLIVMRPFHHMDVAIFIETESRFLSYLSAEVYSEDLPDSPVHIVKVQNHPFVMLPPMTSDKKSYFVQLSSTLQKSKFDYSLPQAAFTANSSFKKLNLSFEPVLKSTEAEISKSTLIGFLFFIGALLAGINFEKLLSLYAEGREYYTEKKALKPVTTESTDTPHIEPVIRRRVKPRKV